VRIAEEMAMVDCISAGRLECGFVRGVPYETFAANTNPSLTLDRLWDGIDLVLKTWTTHDGPFNHEGRFWHKRAVNIWPRPFQEPHPRIWITGSTDRENIKKVAGRGYVFATFLQPYGIVKDLFDIYRESYVDSGMRGGMAFMPLVFTGETEEEAVKGGEELAWFFSTKAEPQFHNPPGYSTREQQIRGLKGAFAGRTAAIRAQGLDYLREAGILIIGTPDSVAAQIERYYERVGGFDHLLVMQQAGFLDHEKTVKSMTLFAKHVIPRIAKLPPSAANRELAANGQQRGPRLPADVNVPTGHAAE
jgi:alkanesulfonate monooxygenase SsuD/methylene tetrahydromethanopterin reductase-like flavin-dependent oxidoreductase (luciferase family)